MPYHPRDCALNRSLILLGHLIGLVDYKALDVHCSEVISYSIRRYHHHPWKTLSHYLIGTIAQELKAPEIHGQNPRPPALLKAVEPVTPGTNKPIVKV
jgi:hypothetical protein